MSDAAGWRTIFVQAETGQMNLTVRTVPDGSLLGRAFLHAGSGRDLLNNRSDVFPVTAGGELAVFVQPFAPGLGGPYRLVLHAVDRTPETRSPAFDMGDTVTGQLGNSADIDDYIFTALGVEHVVLFLDAADSLLPGGVRARLVTPGDSVLATLFNARQGDVLDSVATHRLALPGGGVYRVSISEDVGPVNPDWRFAGDYRFQVWLVNFLPENVPALLVPGDTVEGEAIDRRGDVDLFTLTGGPGDEFHLFFQVTAADTAVRLTLEVPDGPSLLNRRNDGAPLLAAATPAFALPDSGRVTVRLSGPDSGRVTHAGTYRLFPYRIHRPPEIAPAGVTVGDSVAGETIESPGDIDEFLLQAPSASLFQILVTTDPQPEHLSVQAIDPATGALLRSRSLDTPSGALGRVTVPTGGAVRLTFLDPPGCPSTGPCSFGGYVGAYAFKVVSIDPAPEVAPAPYLFGDSVTVETIAPIGDLDEFTFAAVADDTLDLWIRTAAAFTDGPLAAELIQPDGSTLTGRFVGAGQTVTFTALVTADGPHRLRFRAQEDWRGRGAYEFVVRKRP